MLGVFANKVEIDNISCITSVPRGRGIIQPNGQNIIGQTELGIQNDNQYQGEGTIKNTQLGGGDSGEMDGIDSILTLNYDNVLFNFVDDNLKLESDVTANDITFLPGDSGGPICLGCYGANRNLKSTATFKDIWIHKISDDLAPKCGGSWPGPAIIYMPYVPYKDFKKNNEFINQLKDIDITNLKARNDFSTSGKSIFAGGYSASDFLKQHFNEKAKYTMDNIIEKNPNQITITMKNIEDKFNMNITDNQLFFNNIDGLTPKMNLSINGTNYTIDNDCANN